MCCRAATLSIPYLLNSITQSKAKVGWYSLGSLTSAMICMLLGGALADSKGARPSRPPDTAHSALDAPEAEPPSRLDPGSKLLRRCDNGAIARACLLGLAVLSPCIGIAGAAGSAVGVAVAGWAATSLAWSVSVRRRAGLWVGRALRCGRVGALCRARSTLSFAPSRSRAKKAGLPALAARRGC